MSISNLINIRRASNSDLSFVLDIQRRFTNQLGFIPKSKTEKSLQAGYVFLGDLNDQEAGFLLLEPRLSCQPTTAIIVQAAVRMDAQRQLVGLNLVDHLCNVATMNGSSVIQASCADGLDANIFWLEAGFKLVATREGGKRRNQRILIWRKLLTENNDLYNLAVSKQDRAPGGSFARRGEGVKPTLLVTS